MTTSTHLPVCVYCSTARPADRTGCPTCGRPWIDVRIGSGAPPAVGEPTGESDAVDLAGATAATAPDDDETHAESNEAEEPEPATSVTPEEAEPSVEDTSVADASDGDASDDAASDEDADDGADDEDGEEIDPPLPPPAPPAEHETAAVPPPPPPPPPPGNGDRNRRRWLLPAGLAFAIVLVFGAITFIALNRGDGSDPSAAAATTTQLSPTTTALATTEPAPTTAPDTTAAQPTTTSEPSTTTQPTTTTVVPPADSFEPVGEPIPTAQLTLRAGAIGPIIFGTDASEAIGRLVASLGTADETGVAGTDLGMCSEDDGIWVRFGDLTAIVSGGADTGQLVAFQYEAADADSVTPDLATPSGLKIGDTLATLEQIYPNYKLVYQNVDGEARFRLIDNAELLLWGPISSTESGGKVMGISSPPPCPVP